MEIISSALLVAIYLLCPAAVLSLCRKYKWAEKIGPILILYVIGIVIGNLGFIPFIPEQLARPKVLPVIQDVFSSAMVPLAIPLLLLGCTFRRSDTRANLIALVTGIAAVVLSVVAGFLLFRVGIDASSPDSAAEIGGMLTGVYTGGTMNLAAIKTMLGVSDRTYILLNSYDMIISFLYLTFLLSVGIRAFRRFLPPAPDSDDVPEALPASSDPERAEDCRDIRQHSRPPLFGRLWWKQAALLLGVTLAEIAVSAGIAVLLPEGWFMAAFILLLTTAGIAASFVERLRNIKIAEDIGMYCIYVFSIVVASMADLSSLDLSSSLGTLAYLTFVVFGSLCIQVFLAKLFRIDADTIVVCSTAFICSPPFVPMMAAAMKNRRILVGGLSIGIIGYAIGNYLGFLVSRLLALL
ncbi:MAG: DUF819 family protein [Candidatus Cryptobacteroides sp.]